MSEIEVPDGMWTAAMKATLDAGCLINTQQATVAIEAALRWLSENPIAPNEREFGECISNAGGHPILADWLKDAQAKGVDTATQTNYRRLFERAFNAGKESVAPPKFAHISEVASWPVENGEPKFNFGAIRFEPLTGCSPLPPELDRIEYFRKTLDGYVPMGIPVDVGQTQTPQSFDTPFGKVVVDERVPPGEIRVHSWNGPTLMKNIGTE